MQNYTIRSPLAMGGCLISGALSILLLVSPHIHDGLTLRLVEPLAVSAGLVSVAIITGILAHGARDLASRVALAALAACLSAGIVWEQYGRRAQTLNTTQSMAGDSARERARLTKLRAEADEILTTHRAAQARECASGKGKRCDGISYTVRTWEAAVAGYDAKLAAPAATPNAKTENVGIIARLLGYNADNAKTWVAILDPVAVPMLLELAAILCGIVAWGPKVASGFAPVTPSTLSQKSASGFPGFPAEKAEETTLSDAIEAPANENSESEKSVTRIGALSLLDVADDVLVPIVMQRGGNVGTQAHLAKLSGLSEGTISKMLNRSKHLERVWDHHAKCNVVRLRRV